MADVKTVTGTLGGAKVTTSEENAERLGSAFEPTKATTKKSTSSSTSSKTSK
jgi:hypothetical protein